MPNRLTLSPTAQAVIEQEASRIAQLGDAWQPTPENLTEVVKAVLAVEEARFKKQAEGPLEAQEAKPSIGRPSLEIPPAFEALYRRRQAGELLIEDVTCMLGISRHTYYKWVEILRSEGKIAPREKKGKKASAEKKPLGRPKKKTEADKVRLLAFLQDSAPGPKSMTAMSKAEISKHIGFSVGKVKILMREMEEEGLIETHQRTAANGSQLENAYRITRAGKRLLKRALEEEQGKKK